MIVAAVSVLMIVNMQNYLLSSQKFSAKSSHKLEYRSILESLKQVVEGQGFCNKPRTGIVRGSGSSFPARLTGTQIKKAKAPKNLRFDHNGVGINLTKGWKNAQGNIEVTDIRLKYISGWRVGDPHTFATSNTTSLAGKYYLIIDAKICEKPGCSNAESQFVTNERRADDGKLSPYGVDIILEIRFQAVQRAAKDVVLKSNGQAVTCFGPSTGAARCEEMGRIWNPFNSTPENRCEPHNRCLEKKPTGTNENQCSAPYKRILVGYKAGKKPRYICIWCNERADEHTVKNNAP